MPLINRERRARMVEANNEEKTGFLHTLTINFRSISDFSPFCSYYSLFISKIKPIHYHPLDLVLKYTPLDLAYLLGLLPRWSDWPSLLDLALIRIGNGAIAAPLADAWPLWFWHCRNWLIVSLLYCMTIVVMVHELLIIVSAAAIYCCYSYYRIVAS